eukprot:s3463_g9.t1
MAIQRRSAIPPPDPPVPSTAPAAAPHAEWSSQATRLRSIRASHPAPRPGAVVVSRTGPPLNYREPWDCPRGPTKAGMAQKSSKRHEAPKPPHAFVLKKERTGFSRSTPSPCCPGSSRPSAWTEDFVPS